MKNKKWLSAVLITGCIIIIAFNSSTFIKKYHLKQRETGSVYNIGVGKYDITGPAAEEGMMGYAQIDQKTSGILQRDWARAFIIQSPINKKEVVFVNADLAMLFQGVQQKVLQLLKKKYGDEYTASNVILSAIHQHSGPGGYSIHALYNLTTLGFDRKNFNTICQGIVKAIEIAHNHMQPGVIRIATGTLLHASINRSPSAYAKDPMSERKKFRYNTNKQMTLLRFDSIKSQSPIGMINWFSVHGTSLDNKNTLISGDNKGYAAYLFENSYAKNKLVAAFAQSDAGDVSPNVRGHGGAHGAAGRRNVEDIGGKQYRKALALFRKAKADNAFIHGTVDFRQQYVAMGNQQFKCERLKGCKRNHLIKTCPAAIGESMLAGTSDGRGGFGKQGITSCKQVSGALSQLQCNIMTKKTQCQGVKPIVLETNSQTPPLTPKVMPFSIIKLGNLGIIVSPFELTTMAGRRVRASVLKELTPAGVNKVVIAGYSNAYGGYVTTPEEYKAQRYEGASNLFGPQSLNAQIDIYRKLAHALVYHKKAPKSATLSDMLSWPQTNLQTGVIADAPILGKHFGDLLTAPREKYNTNSTVNVQFVGAHPRNNYKTMGSFLEVQQRKNHRWKTVYTDNDWCTQFSWQRKGIAASAVSVIWRIPKNQAAGKYRVIYNGDAKALNGNITAFSGVSPTFTVVESDKKTK